MRFHICATPVRRIFVHAFPLSNGRSFTSGDGIQLARRMSELDICSRREASRLIASGKVFVRGELAELGQKVRFDESEITVLKDKEEEKMARAIVLNKPIGYVSGQPEHGHIPAIRLLSRENVVKDGMNIDQDGIELQTNYGLAPAGRLDLKSTGLLIFCRDGVLAKKLVSHIIEKEYVVNVGPAHQPNGRERQYGMTKMRHPRLDLKILKGGACLLGDNRPLKPVVRSTWTIPGEQLRIVLKEGRKQQIRRMMRELLGFHVTSLERVRIGNIHLDETLPQGKWRPLSDTEIENILQQK